MAKNNIQLNSKFLLPIVAFALIFGVCVFGSNVLIKKVSEKVIQQIQRDYTPGPYSPGFDPDKVDPRFFRNNQQPLQQSSPPPSMQNQNPNQTNDFPTNQGVNNFQNMDDYLEDIPMKAPLLESLDSPDRWNKMWENSRF